MKHHILVMGQEQIRHYTKPAILVMILVNISSETTNCWLLVGIEEIEDVCRQEHLRLPQHVQMRQQLG